MNIPFYSCAKSLKQQWSQTEIMLKKVISTGIFTKGPLVKELEQEVQNYTGARYAVGVGNGTDALIIILKAAGIGVGDEVLVPCFTFFASASSIAHVGATPVFVDIDPDTYNMDVQDMKRKITSRTRAIMPVHLFSQMADMPAIKEVAEQYNLMILEDSAEGIGMWCDGKHAGLWGKAGTLSFFPTKTLGAFGDAGMILTDDEELAKTCSMLRNHGQDEVPYIHKLVGYNSRMDEIQSAILLVRLKHLSREIAKRASLANYYTSRLEKLQHIVSTPKFKERKYSCNQVYYVYLIEVDRRDELLKYLKENGIETETYYPIPLHIQPCFEYLGYKQGELPMAECACKRTLALPLYPDMNESEVDYVCRHIEMFYEGGK